MPKKILYFLLYNSILFLPLYMVRFSVFKISTNLIEMLIWIAFVLWLFQLKKTSKILVLPKIYHLSFLFLFLGLIISAILNDDWVAEAGIIKGWFITPFLFFMMIIDQIDSSEKRAKLLRVSYVSAVFVGLISIFYLWAGKLTFDGRLEAIYLSPNYLAMFLSSGIIIGFFSIAEIILLAKKRYFSFYFLAFSLLIMLVALYFTFSYGAWLAISLGIMISLALSKSISHSQKVYALLLAIVLFILLFFSQSSRPKMNALTRLEPRSSAASRIMIWESAWKIGWDNPVWGIGPGNFQKKYLEYQRYFPPYLEWAVPQPHNLYLAFWLQSGLLGLFSFLVLVGAWSTQMIRHLNKRKGNFLETAFLATIFSILIHGVIDTPYWKNDLAILFWMIIALGLSFIFSPDPGDTDSYRVD